MREYLISMRRGKHWSQVVAANVYGISQGYYSAIECGEKQKDMSRSIIVKLASAFEVPAQTIIEAEAAYIAQLRNSA